MTIPLNNLIIPDLVSNINTLAYNILELNRDHKLKANSYKRQARELMIHFIQDENASEKSFKSKFSKLLPRPQSRQTKHTINLFISLGNKIRATIKDLVKSSSKGRSKLKVTQLINKLAIKYLIGFNGFGTEEFHHKSNRMLRSLYKLVDLDRKPLPYDNGHNPSNPDRIKYKIEAIGLH